jgi:ATP-dependent RNA helicase RhlE
VFTRTKHGANKLTEQLIQDGISAAAIHGNKSQGARTKALADFKSGSIRALVATDVAARGIDIDKLPHVVNYELPNVPEDYVHRIGRTGRAEAEGEAVSLVCVDEQEFLRDIEKLIKKPIPKSTITGFEPDPNAKAEPIKLGHRTTLGGRGKPTPKLGEKPRGSKPQSTKQKVANPKVSVKPQSKNSNNQRSERSSEQKSASNSHTNKSNPKSKFTK